MVTRALEGDRIIGMTLLRPGHGEAYEGRPPIFAVGCAGLITHVERQNDGRFNLILRGLEKFRIDVEEPPTDGVLYRIAHVTSFEELIEDGERQPLRDERRRLEAMLESSLDRERNSRLPRDMADDELVNALSQYPGTGAGREAGPARTAGSTRPLPHPHRPHRDEADAAEEPRRRAAALMLG